MAREAARLHEGGTVRWDEIAVFYRTNAQSRIMEDQFMRGGIPYKVVGGTRFYDRREIKDTLAYVKAISNESDEVSVKRVLNVPKRGIGDTTEGRIDAYARSHDLSFKQAMRRIEDVGVASRAVKAISAFVGLLDELADLVPDGPATLIEAILDRTGYVAELELESTIDAEGRIENLAELVGVAQGFEEVDAFLEQVSLVADTDDLGEDSQVTLMTLHSAKGLEYPVVFLVGLEEGVSRTSAPSANRPRWKRNAAWPMWASPGPVKSCSCPAPGPACCSAPPSTTRPAGFSMRSPTS